MKLRHVRISRVFLRAATLFKQYSFRIVLSLIMIGIALGGIFVYRLLLRANVKPQDLLSFFGSPVENLESTNGMTNFLILGIRGEGSDSPNLSDTIMVISYDHETKTPTMIGIPRDLWVPSIRDRMNTAYHYGEEASPGAGIKLAQASVLEDLGVPIHYTAVINFTMFKQAIDLVGGIDVDVKPGFTDPQFPIPGRENALPVSSRYESVTFIEGVRHFDGETALKFVRSRHSEGDEGTDFARSRRQQQVIGALREKILIPEFFLDQDKVLQLFDIVDNNLITNIRPVLYPTLAKVGLDTRENKIKTITLSDSPDDNGVAILFNPPVKAYDGKWVLIPKDNNWNALKQYVKNRLSGAQ